MSNPGPSLFVAYSGLNGGAERLLVELLAGLDGPLLLACPPGPLSQSAREHGIPVVELRERPLELRGAALSKIAALAGHAREVRRLVRDLEPGLVFTWGMRPSLAALVALAGLRPRPPWLVRHHDFLPGPLIGAGVRRALMKADAVVVNSRAVGDDLGFGEVIYPGVDLGRFEPAGDPPPGPPVALWLGAIIPWKRPDLALEIAARVPGLRLRLAGEPLGAAGDELLARLRDRVARPDLEGRVELPGRVDPHVALSEAALLLQTADREPFGIAVAEALAAGVPVVAPDAGGPAEVVDPSCGRLFAAGDAERAAAAVREVLACGLGAGARRRAEEMLDLERAREEFGELVVRHRKAVPRSGAQLALVTVTHNSCEELGALLRSVDRHLPDARVVVVDSGSTDGSGATAREHGAEVIELENVGYGPAANAGLAAVSEAVTVILNPDVELLDDSLATCAEELARNDRILAPAVILPDGSRQDVAQHEPATLAMLALALVPPALLPRRVRVGLEPWRASAPRRAGWAVGACIAGRTDTLRKLGPFDPEVFLYAEDLDLGLRAADAGIETWFWPPARVLHRRAHSTARAFGGEPFDLLARRRREVITARRGSARARVDDALSAITFANRIVLKTIARRETKRERRQLAALGAARRSP